MQCSARALTCLCKYTWPGSNWRPRCLEHACPRSCRRRSMLPLSPAHRCAVGGIDAVLVGFAAAGARLRACASSGVSSASCANVDTLGIEPFKRAPVHAVARRAPRRRRGQCVVSTRLRFRPAGFAQRGWCSRQVGLRNGCVAAALGCTAGSPAGTGIIEGVTAVGFEPTPLRTGALSQRLRPLGQTVSPSGRFALRSSAAQSWLASLLQVKHTMRKRENAC